MKNKITPLKVHLTNILSNGIEYELEMLAKAKTLTDDTKPAAVAYFSKRGQKLFAARNIIQKREFSKQ